jgi:lysyl-tRNA synthetase class 1
LHLHKALPEQVANLTPEQRQALGILGQRLQPEMDGDTIHTLVYALAEEVALPARALFEAIYIALLDQPRGPRVGWFLSSLDDDFVRTRFQDAAALGR